MFRLYKSLQNGIKQSFALYADDNGYLTNQPMDIQMGKRGGNHRQKYYRYRNRYGRSYDGGIEENKRGTSYGRMNFNGLGYRGGRFLSDFGSKRAMNGFDLSHDYPNYENPENNEIDKRIEMNENLRKIDNLADRLSKLEGFSKYGPGHGGEF